MTQEQAIKMAYDMGGHPYSVSVITAALLKGVEIGKEEQKTIDIVNIPQLYYRWLMIHEEPGFEKPSWEEYVTEALNK